MSVDILKKRKSYNLTFTQFLSYKHYKFSSAPAAAKEKDENGAEPSAPITKKGVLTSFLTGKQMTIPESDLVSMQFLVISSQLGSQALTMFICS